MLRRTDATPALSTQPSVPASSAAQNSGMNASTCWSSWEGEPGGGCGAVGGCEGVRALMTEGERTAVGRAGQAGLTTTRGHEPAGGCWVPAAAPPSGPRGRHTRERAGTVAAPAPAAPPSAAPAAPLRKPPPKRLPTRGEYREVAHPVARRGQVRVARRERDAARHEGVREGPRHAAPLRVRRGQVLHEGAVHHAQQAQHAALRVEVGHARAAAGVVVLQGGAERAGQLANGANTLAALMGCCQRGRVQAGRIWPGGAAALNGPRVGGPRGEGGVRTGRKRRCSAPLFQGVCPKGVLTVVWCSSRTEERGT